MKRFKAIGLFTGIGGLELGFHKVGMEFVKSLEFDEKCCEVQLANKEILGIQGDDIAPVDISKTDPDDFYQKKIDYIVGGPPCQSFSAAGRRAGGVAGISDTRGSLFWFYCKYVDHFKPKAFVFENVRGILSSAKGNDFKIICNSFEKIGYKLFYRVLNASDYGVPQSRDRLFLVGIRSDIGIDFKFPRPLFGPDSASGQNYITAGRALSDLDNPNEVEQPYGGKYGHLLPEIPNGENYRFFTEEMGHPSPLFAWRSKFSGFLAKLDPNDVSKTIVAYQGKYDGPFHWKNRKCTAAELKRLQGFPDEYTFVHSYGTIVKQIGNSVCPPVSEAVAKALLSQLEGCDFPEIEFLDGTEKLSSGRRSGLKAIASKSKIQRRHKDIVQGNLFDKEHKDVAPLEKHNFSLPYPSTQTDVKYEDKNIGVTLHGKVDDKLIFNLELTLFGSVTKKIEKITVDCFSENEDALAIAWDIINKIVDKYSTFSNLLPLYGHFTEPYPKFSCSFKPYIKSDLFEFQKIALKETYNRKIISLRTLEDKCGNGKIQFVKQLRDYGFDVRTNNTNSTIPEGMVRICYPFIMPKNEKRYMVWKEVTNNENIPHELKKILAR